MKILALDGNSIINRAFYGIKLLTTKNGEYTNAIYGTFRTILKIIREQKPTHMAVVFDKSRDTFRREMYADYKGTRGATPEPLKQQFVLIEEVLGEIGLKVLFDDNYEADDLAGVIRKSRNISNYGHKINIFDFVSSCGCAIKNAFVFLSPRKSVSCYGICTIFCCHKSCFNSASSLGINIFYICRNSV